jgi:hypothetical protein
MKTKINTGMLVHKANTDGNANHELDFKTRGINAPKYNTQL